MKETKCQASFISSLPKFIGNLKSEKVYKELLDAVNPHILLYDECLIRLLGVSDVLGTEEEMVSKMKLSVGESGQ